MQRNASAASVRSFLKVYVCSVELYFPAWSYISKNRQCSQSASCNNICRDRQTNVHWSCSARTRAQSSAVPQWRALSSSISGFRKGLRVLHSHSRAPRAELSPAFGVHRLARVTTSQLLYSFLLNLFVPFFLFSCLQLTFSFLFVQAFCEPFALLTQNPEEYSRAAR